MKTDLIFENKHKPLFSIVVCTYNGASHIEKCLNSLLNQTFPKNNYEIIVIDDGSTDETKNIVKKYPVKLISHTKNGGVSAARNTGLQHVKGKIWVNFDDDCYADKNWLRNLANAYKLHKNEEILGISGLIHANSNSRLTDFYLDETGYGNPSPAYYGRSKNPFVRFYSYLKSMFRSNEQHTEKLSEVGEIWGANCSFPISVLKAVKGWNDQLSGVEDTDLCNRIKKEFPTGKLLCVNDAVIYHNHKLPMKKFIQKPYLRGDAILKFYRQDKKLPPIFPFPIIIAAFTCFSALINPLYSLLSLILLPQILYSWWLLKAIKKRDITYLTFPYIQALRESSLILGVTKAALKKPFHVKREMLKIELTSLAFLLISALINLVIVSHINFYFSREILSSIYLLVFPGIIFSWALGLRYKSLWEGFIFTVGISVAILMIGGLGINYILPLIHISQPLTKIPFLFSLNELLFITWLIAFMRNTPFPFEKIEKGISIKNLIIGATSVYLPILSILGAINLNNNHGNIMTMILLGITASLVLIITLSKKFVDEKIYPFILFMISLSLLFMTSLRGWFITGHDIFLEYYVFQLTKLHGIWTMANFQDPYNACLSITLLPTILANITGINDPYIYKLLFQIIFSLSTVATYLFIKRFISPFLAFLGTFAIVSLPTFMTDMPMLNRQEIALFFFVIILYTLFNNNFSKKLKWTFFLIFGFGLLLSHYSTTYITVGLFVGSFLLHLLISTIKRHPHARNFITSIEKKLGLIDKKPNLHVGMVIILLAATVIWNVNITNTAQGITTTINQIQKALKTAHFEKTKNDPSSYGLLNKKAKSKQDLLNQYVDSTTKFVRQFNDNSAFLDKQIFSQYPVTLSNEDTQPLTIIGNLMKQLHINLFTFNDGLKQLYAKVIQIFIVIGFISIFFFKKHISNFEREYFILAVTFFGILILQTILPAGAIDYGILRLFQQGMVLFAVPFIMGGMAVFSIFNFINKNIRIVLLSGTIIFFFLYLSGFIPAVTGGYYPQMNLANSGFYYDAYYTHTQDKIAMDWLEQSRDIKTPVQSDWFALKKILTYENFYSIDGLIPSVIRRNSYVYLSVSNIETGRVIVYVNGAPIYYKYSFDFLDKNKNLIYNNGGAKIFR